LEIETALFFRGYCGAMKRVEKPVFEKEIEKENCETNINT
jgi:hypothetical protein